MFKAFLIGWIALLLLGLPMVALAQGAGADSKPEKDPNCPPGRQCLQNPLAPVGKDKTGPTDVRVIIGTIIKGALGVLGSVALYAFINGGATWLLSFGNPEKVKGGAMTMLWAALGLLVVLASYFLLNQFFILLTSSPK